MKLLRRNGFTATELLVVIAIMAITMAIAFPVFARSKKTAKTTEMVQHLHSLQVAAAIYQSDENGATSGTQEEMALPSWWGTLRPYPRTNVYLAPWYAEMKSPFGTTTQRDYHTFALPAAVDNLPVPWSVCTRRTGDACVLYWDPHEPGQDPTDGSWLSTSPYARKRLHAVTLAGTLVAHEAYGDPYSQEWWMPGTFNRNE